MEKERVIEKLASFFKEEAWGRMDPKDMGISRFRILDEFHRAQDDPEALEEIVKICREHLNDRPDSITARYLLGLIAYETGTTDDRVFLKQLVDQFLGYHKWAVVEHLAEIILEYGENRHALKAMGMSLERLGRQKEAIPVWEDILRLDRFDAEVAKKLSFAIAEDEPARGVHYLKMALEGYIRNGQFKSIQDIWNKLVDLASEDLAYFEKVERMLLDAKRQDLAVALIRALYEEYRETDPLQAISFIKKILRYQTDDQDLRRDIVHLFKICYGEHSLFEQFLQLSQLSNLRVPLDTAIKNFENSIVFDKGNYVHHRTWGVGLISEMDHQNVIIDFQGKSGHKMSLQMALQSLTSVPKDHLYVRMYTDPESVKQLFEKDFHGFFELLMASYGNEILVSDIKRELIPAFIEQKNWSKWWTKARNELKKNPSIGFSEQKKDLIFVREQPVRYVDELLSRFDGATSFSGRLDIAQEFANNVSSDEAVDAIGAVAEYFVNAAGAGSQTKMILSYFLLRDLAKKFGDRKEFRLAELKKEVMKFIADHKDLSGISAKITSYDSKKEFVNLIEEVHNDWPDRVVDLLFETPIRIHRHVFNDLVRAGAYSQINTFIERITSGARQVPEVFLWVAKSILTGVWNFEWLDYSNQYLVLTFFRLLNDFKKTDATTIRLRNIAVNMLMDADYAVLRLVVAQSDQTMLRRLYDVAISADYLEESLLERFLLMIKAKFPEFSPEGAKSDEGQIVDDEEILVTAAGFERKQAELAHLVNVELVNLSRDLSSTADVSGDVRENVDYNVLMEKQSVLKLNITRLEAELRRARIIQSEQINTDSVSVGCVVEIEEVAGGDHLSYTILGPWDADYEHNILTYRSPLAGLLLGRKVGDEVMLKVRGDDERAYRIASIQRYL